MPTIRVLTSVAGENFEWNEGDLVDVDGATAKAWCDGVRAERVSREEQVETATGGVSENTARRPGRPRTRT